MEDTCDRCGHDYLFRKSGRDETVQNPFIVPAKYFKSLRCFYPSYNLRYCAGTFSLCASHMRAYSSKAEELHRELRAECGIVARTDVKINCENDRIAGRVVSYTRALQPERVARLPAERLNEMLLFLGEQFGHKVTLENVGELNIEDLNLQDEEYDTDWHSLVVLRYVEKYSIKQFTALWMNLVREFCGHLDCV